MRSMASELGQLHGKCGDLKLEIGRYKKELAASKNEYFAKRKRGLLVAESADAVDFAGGEGAGHVFQKSASPEAGYPPEPPQETSADAAAGQETGPPGGGDGE